MGVPLGDKCALPAVRVRLSGCGLRAANSGAVKAKPGTQGWRLLGRLVVAGGVLSALFMAPPSSASGSTLSSSSSLPVPPRNQPVTRQMWVQTPPMPPAQGCTASPRPRGSTGAGELGDDTSRKARPQLGVRGSRGATRGRLQTTPALRKDPVTAARAGVVLMRVVFPGESECLLSAYITTSSSESPLLTCLPVVCLDCPSFTVSGSRVSLFKSPDILICVLNLLCN